MERLNSKGLSSRFKWIIAAVLALPLVVYGSINTFDRIVGNRLDIDNVRTDGNTISTTNANGDLTFDMNGTGSIILNDLTATTVPFLDASKKIASSAVTPTELGFLSGVTSAIQTQLNGKQPIPVVTTKTSADSPYTVTSTDQYIIANTAGGNITLNFPAAASNTGKIWIIKKTSASNKVILDGNAAENIDVDATIDLISNQAMVEIFSDGTQLRIRAIKDPWRVDSNIVGADISLGAADISTYTGMTNGGLTLTNNNGQLTAQIACATTTASTGTTCTAALESNGIAFIPPRSMSVLACVSFGLLADVTAAQNSEFSFQIVETPNNAQTISEESNTRLPSWVGNGTVATRVGLPYRLCGNIDVSRTDATTFAATLRLFYEMNQTGGGTYSISSDGDVNSGQLDIHWEVYPLN